MNIMYSCALCVTIYTHGRCSLTLARFGRISLYGLVRSRRKQWFWLSIRHYGCFVNISFKRGRKTVRWRCTAVVSTIITRHFTTLLTGCAFRVGARRKSISHSEQRNNNIDDRRCVCCQVPQYDPNEFIITAKPLVFARAATNNERIVIFKKILHM